MNTSCDQQDKSSTTLQETSQEEIKWRVENNPAKNMRERDVKALRKNVESEGIVYDVVHINSTIYQKNMNITHESITLRGMDGQTINAYYISGDSKSVRTPVSITGNHKYYIRLEKDEKGENRISFAIKYSFVHPI